MGTFTTNWKNAQQTYNTNKSLLNEAQYNAATAGGYARGNYASDQYHSGAQRQGMERDLTAAHQRYLSDKAAYNAYKKKMQLRTQDIAIMKAGVHYAPYETYVNANYLATRGSGPQIMENPSDLYEGAKIAAQKKYDEACQRLYYDLY